MALFTMGLTELRASAIVQPRLETYIMEENPLRPEIRLSGLRYRRLRYSKTTSRFRPMPGANIRQPSTRKSREAIHTPREKLFLSSRIYPVISILVYAHIYIEGQCLSGYNRRYTRFAIVKAEMPVLFPFNTMGTGKTVVSLLACCCQAC